ncbi:hypothetical protein TrVFT333_010956 [Trichoderma virens FT-333]|nr:hypothetical protein TrVFT333_010956 [Trichoderma virens FT-333]
MALNILLVSEYLAFAFSKHSRYHNRHNVQEDIKQAKSEAITSDEMVLGTFRLASHSYLTPILRFPTFHNKWDYLALKACHQREHPPRVRKKPVAAPY